jgi:mRNA-degrading endonuclease toxin of MazEF toxin-antitoxin module
MQPGEVYLADLQEAGRHPVIVVSREELNRGHYVLVVPCTSARFATRSQLPNCVPFRPGQFGFTVACVAQCEQVFPLDLRETPLGEPVGRLDDRTLRDVIKAVGFVIESDCEPV